MSSDVPPPQVSALAINVVVPDDLRWTDTRRGQEFTLSTLNIRLLADGRLKAKAYGRPTASDARSTSGFWPILRTGSWTPLWSTTSTG